MSLFSADIFLVTVTYNAEKDVKEFFECFFQLDTKNIHLIVVDNASSDSTTELIGEIESERQDVTLISNSVNRGVAAANNQGIKLALREKASWVVLINNDVSFSGDLINNLIRDKREKVTVPLIPYYSDPDTIWFSTGRFSALRGFTGTHIDKDRSIETLSVGSTSYSEYAPTCCMAIQAEVFSVVGLMDESFFVYFDDTDFCWRLKNAGIRIRAVHDTLLLHKVGSSTGGADSPFTVKYTSRNRVYFLKKNKGLAAALLFLPIFLGYYFYKYAFKSWLPDLLLLAARGLYLGYFLGPRNDGSS